MTQDREQPEFGSIVRVILLSFLIITLPVVAWTLFGWMHMMLPLLAFYILNKYGGYTGKRFLVIAVFLSAIVFTMLKSVDLLFLSSTLLLSGYVLFSSAEKKESPVLSGIKASATVALGWSLLLAYFTIGENISLYDQLLLTLDEGIGEALVYYRQSDTVAPETLAMLETTLYQMKTVMPLIMPAILGGIILLVTWFTMVVGNNLSIRLNGSSPWISYDKWQLPEKLIWLGILLGLATITPATIFQLGGINGLILLSIIYCFQGLAIAVFFMNKWKVPILLRSFFYVIMILQSFGTVLLLFLGVTDIWFDYRRLKKTAENEQN